MNIYLIHARLIYGLVVIKFALQCAKLPCQNLLLMPIFRQRKLLVLRQPLVYSLHFLTSIKILSHSFHYTLIIFRLHILLRLPHAPLKRRLRALSKGGRLGYSKRVVANVTPLPLFLPLIGRKVLYVALFCQALILGITLLS